MISFTPSETPGCSPDSPIISRTIHQHLVPWTPMSLCAVKNIGDFPNFLMLFSSYDAVCMCVYVYVLTHTWMDGWMDA